MRRYSVIPVVLFLLLTSSCATIIHGSYQKVSVSSDPPGARVYLNGVATNAVTPAKITVPRKAGAHMIKFERPGYQDYNYSLQNHFNGLVVLDFLWLFPGVIDVAVGAHNMYDKIAFAQMTRSEAGNHQEALSRGAATPEKYSFNRISDVDLGIPETKDEHDSRYALIIGNEEYTLFQKDLGSEINVAFARDDASAFKDYAQKLLGIPERNITFLLDATAAEMRQGIEKLNLLAKNSGGRGELFVFYAGHGLPDEATKEPYLIPVDVSGKYISVGIPLKELYGQLAEYPTERVTVFLDACFSGGARNQGLVASRGVRITPKNASLKGNMIVFTASGGDESALPYIKKNHGLFTYHLLQKLKDTEGEISYKALSEYLEQNIPLESVIINSKEQHPKTLLSPDILNTWESWTFD